VGVEVGGWGRDRFVPPSNLPFVRYYRARLFICFNRIFFDGVKPEM